MSRKQLVELLTRVGEAATLAKRQEQSSIHVLLALGAGLLERRLYGKSPKRREKWSLRP